MSKFTKTQKEYRWQDIEAMLEKRIGAERTSALFCDAGTLSGQYAEKYRKLKGFERRHAEAAYNIAAIFIPLRREIGAEEAVELLDEVWKPAAMKSNEKYDRLPPGLFIRLCRVIAGTAFGNKAGFVRKDISKDRNEVRFDVTSCPYVRIMTELGCSEACPIVCRQDEYTYGGLKGVAFERTMTLGRGDEKCDFCYRLKGKDE